MKLNGLLEAYNEHCDNMHLPAVINGNYQSTVYADKMNGNVWTEFETNNSYLTGDSIVCVLSSNSNTGTWPMNDDMYAEYTERLERIMQSAQSGTIVEPLAWAADDKDYMDENTDEDTTLERFGVLCNMLAEIVAENADFDWNRYHGGETQGVSVTEFEDMVIEALQNA